MKWIMLAIGLAFGAEWAITRDSVTIVFALLFIIAALSIWKDEDDTV